MSSDRPDHTRNDDGPGWIIPLLVAVLLLMAGLGVGGGVLFYRARVREVQAAREAAEDAELRAREAHRAAREAAARQAEKAQAVEAKEP